MESGVSSGVWRSATTNRTVKAWCKPTSFTKPFYFISLADTQLGMVQGALGSTFLPLVGWKGGNSTAAIYDAEKEMSKLTVKYINKLNPLPVFVIVCGDLVHSMPSNLQAQNLEVQDFKSIFSKLNQNIKLMCLCGNHDVGDKPTPMTIDLYKRRFSDDYYSFWYEGVKFMVLNSQLYKFDENAKQLSMEQEKWFDEQLIEMKNQLSSNNMKKKKKQNGNRVDNNSNETNDKTTATTTTTTTTNSKETISTSILSSSPPPLITTTTTTPRCCVFTHIPPFIENQNEGNGYFPLDKSVRLKLLKRLSNHNCTHWFSGHYHRNVEGTYINEETGQSIECVTSGAVGGNIINDTNGDPKELNGMKELRLDKNLSGMRFVFVKHNCMNHCYLTLNDLETKYHLNDDDGGGDEGVKFDINKIERDQFSIVNIIDDGNDGDGNGEILSLDGSSSSSSIETENKIKKKLKKK